MKTSVVPTAPEELRELIRRGEFSNNTAGLAPGYLQTNIAILPRELAFDFLLFCQRNPKPCPLIEVLDPGSYTPKESAPRADLRSDVPKYRVYENGELTNEITDISSYWRSDLVTFLLGCSFTFETAMMNTGISLRHIEARSNIPMFITNIETVPAGIFSGPMVVSMRPIPEDQIVRTIQVTSRFPSVHGAPIHIGEPEAIGIKDITRPDLGDAVEIKNAEVPIFWACGVTPQSVAMNSKPPLMITHSPGHMFITDRRDEEFSVI